MSKSKNQGTRWETELCGILTDVFDTEACRLAEGGNNDRGDISFDLAGREWVIEARDRETMQVHRAAVAAQAKAGNAISAVIWKRKKLKPGNTVRTQVGPPVVIMTLAEWLEMVVHLTERET